MCPPCGYKSLPYIVIAFTIIEMILGLTRIIIFFVPRTSTNTTSNDTIPSPFLSSKPAIAAFILDWIASIIPTLVFVYVMLLLCLASYACCIGGVVQSGVYCYKPRPQLRFQIRVGLMCLFIILRIIAIVLYATNKTSDNLYIVMAGASAISVIFIFLTIIIDLYQYRMWLYYRPEGAYKRCRCLCCRQVFHPSHQSFLPAPLLGENRKEDQLGNQPCLYTKSGNCPNLSLEHIVIFHAMKFLPQMRYDPNVHTTYFGFHQLNLNLLQALLKQAFGLVVPHLKCLALVSILLVHSLVFICANIQMKRVLRVSVSEINKVSNSNEWWKEYDTVYYDHNKEELDEFCIKDPSQILKCVIIMEDDIRIRNYGLDKELENTRCGCV